MNWKKAFTLTSFNLSSVCHARLCAVSFYQEFDGSRTFLLYKKESCLQDSPPAAGRFSDTLPLRRSAILSGAFLCHRTKFPYERMKQARTFVAQACQSFMIFILPKSDNNRSAVRQTAIPHHSLRKSPAPSLRSPLPAPQSHLRRSKQSPAQTHRLTWS